MRGPLVFIIMLMFCSACKISLSGADTGDAKTISIAFFKNQASLVQPTLSQSFTEDLRNFFQSQSNLSIVSQNGDLQIEGVITDYRVTPVAISGQSASVNRLTITVRVQFSNTKDPEKDFDSSFSRFADFPSSQNLVTVESELISQINQQLAQDIFNKAVINW